ncbi:MAG TPA: tricarboxylate transporter [Bacteroidales bacterium]|jgi:di/tricarboxylate transporter|nr:tricarboxylate transporter [Bacteroidales bacterium]
MIKINTVIVDRSKIDFKLILFGIFVLAAIWVGLFLPWIPSLSVLGHRVIMGLIITVGLWVFKPWGIPFSVSGCFLMMILLINGMPPGIVFSGFTSTALWVLIPALFFGFTLIRTGLGQRVSFLIVKAFKPSIGGLLLAWVVIGLVLSALTPSIAVRVAIVMPLALSCVELCNLEKGSNGRGLILLTAWAMVLLPGTGWLSGSLLGPIIMGLYNATPGLEGIITFSSWSKVALLPISIMNLFLVVGGCLIFWPKEKLMISKEVFSEKYRKLGPITKQEKTAAAILIISFILFASSQLHGVIDAAICLGGFFVLTLTGVIKVKDISCGINWDLPIFVGVIMGLSASFMEAGISSWLSGVLVPLLAPFASNPWLFALVVVVSLFLIRFFDITGLVPTMAIIVPIIPEVYEQFGINPLVWVTLFILAGKCFFMSYQNMFALVGESILGESGWTAKQMCKYGFVYLASCFIALAIAIPYWKSLGFFS